MDLNCASPLQGYAENQLLIIPDKWHPLTDVRQILMQVVINHFIYA